MSAEIAKVAENICAMHYVIKGLEVLKRDSGSWRETLLIGLTLTLYQHRLAKARHTISPQIWEAIERGICNIEPSNLLDFPKGV